jgi:purine-binding chemotaxis protein CheW
MKNPIPAAVQQSGSPEPVSRACKYLSFRLSKEEFAIEVNALREIMGMQDIEAVPEAPQYLKGVINLRGKVIPVIDLRLKLGLPQSEYTHRSSIIVVQIENGAERMLLGLIVDGVSDVLTLKPGEIDDTPDFRDGSDSPHVLGMAKIKGRVKILLDANKVLSVGEVRGLESLLTQPRAM